MVYMLGITGKKMVFETGAGLISGEIYDKSVKVKLFNPKDLELGIILPINGNKLDVSFINTGVPHAVIFVKDIEKTDVEGLGRAVRYHRRFAPKGANADFVQAGKNNAIYIRTYERGVEGETLACGTGVTASAIIAIIRGLARSPVKCITRGGSVFKVSADIDGRMHIENIYLEGPADPVFTGEIII